MAKFYLTNALNIAKEICQRKVAPGDTVIDATMGNGNDTLFLAGLVGKGGRVYAFDIQKSAIINTRARVEKHGVEDVVFLIQDSHENVDKYINEKISAAVFNLGYLPSGDHSIITKANTTIEAIKRCLALLKEGGIVVIVIYYGHPGGMEERVSVENFAQSLDQKQYNVIELSFINQINEPPILICIEKR